MGPLRRSLGLASPIVLLAFLVNATYAQTLPAAGQCVTSSSPSQVRAEGLAERLGDIVIKCTAATPGTAISGNLTVFLPVNVTNRVDSSNLTQDAVLSVDYGSGFVSTGIPGRVGSQSVAFNGFSVTAPSSGMFSLGISGIRGNVNQLGQMAGIQPITAQLSVPFPISPAQAIVGFPQGNSLYINAQDTGIACTGSPFPADVSIANLFAVKTAFVSTRLTEGSANAFEPRRPGADSGTRFLVSYSGFPANARVYLPDAVAGSDALVPTAGGDLGGTQSGGQYVPGSGTLLLVRVPDADAAGAGGNPVAAPTGAGPAPLDAASEVPLAKGAGYAVYEVADSNSNISETAQFPLFIRLAGVTAAAKASEAVSLAPVSSVTTASTAAPVPRFAAVTPASDCSVVGDCDAAYFPRLSLTYSPVTFTYQPGQRTPDPAVLVVNNTGGGTLNWNASIAYTAGSGWLYIDNTAGQWGANIRVFLKPEGLAAGAYSANVIVDAGPYAGRVSVPVTLTVQPAPAPALPSVTVSRVVNAATFESTPLVAGSLGTLFGAGLAGKDVAASFDGLPAALLYSGESQINFQVPPALGSKASTALVVTVDGASSTPVTVTLAPAAPAIFAHGVLNQDNTSNTPEVAAGAGSILQIFGTGIPAGAIVTAEIGGRKGLVPIYAGIAPGVTGAQQVNVAVPEGLAPGSVPLTICAAIGQQQYCSPGYALFVK
jgi:uncharacterized protein (TIGR03437 family)